MESSAAVPAPGPVCPPGALHAACKSGDVVAVHRILSGPAEDFSTEETDEVLFTGYIMVIIHAADAEFI